MKKKNPKISPASSPAKVLLGELEILASGDHQCSLSIISTDFESLDPEAKEFLRKTGKFTELVDDLVVVRFEDFKTTFQVAHVLYARGIRFLVLSKADLVAMIDQGGGQ